MKKPLSIEMVDRRQDKRIGLATTGFSHILLSDEVEEAVQEEINKRSDYNDAVFVKWASETAQDGRKHDEMSRSICKNSN